MTATSAVPSGADDTIAQRDEAAWNDHARRLDGHLLQSWQWGAFKRLHGWDVERISVGDSAPLAAAQVLFKQRGPVSLAYIPRGPVVAGGDDGALRELFGRIDDVCRARRALNVIVEPNTPLPLTGRYKAAGFVRGPAHVQPARTVKVPLLADDALLGQMHQKTRYNIRLAQRRGVAIARGGADRESVASFYALLRDTSDRNEFGIHEERYYEDFLRVFEAGAVLLFALVEGVTAAGLIAARFGDEAIYMYGGSSTEHRAHGAAFYLQFEAMRWARESGCTRYDLWGIPSEDPPSTRDEGDRVAGTRGQDWRGLYKFKTSFGGQTVDYPPTLERRYRPLLALVARRFYANRTGRGDG